MSPIAPGATSVPRPNPVLHKSARNVARVIARGLRQRLGYRLSQLVSIYIVVSTLAGMGVLQATGYADDVPRVAVSGLTWLSIFVGGLGGLSLARGLAGLTSDPVLDKLATWRGLSEDERRRGTYRAAASVLAWLVALPTGVLMAVALGLSRSPGELTSRLLLLSASLAYALLLAVTLAFVAVWASRTWQARAGSLWLAVTLGPLPFHEVLPDLLSIPGAFGWLLDQLPRLGAYS